jgi:galactose oxidase
MPAQPNKCTGLEHQATGHFKHRGDDDDAMNGNAMMYDFGKILTIGRAPNYDFLSASHRAYTIDINGPEVSKAHSKRPAVSSCSGDKCRASPRWSLLSEELTSVKFFSVFETEVWNPLTTLKPMRVPRTYHSVGLIMKDGRVWAAGK